MELRVQYLQKFYKQILFGNKQQLAFLEDLFTLIADGIPVNRAIEMMAKTSRGIKLEVSLYLIACISKGQALADGMTSWFNPNVVEIIRVGEAGGALVEALKSAINLLTKRGVAISAFANAFAYPLFTIVMASVVIIYIKGHVFTQFEYIKPYEQWPYEGKRLVMVANFISHWWWLVIIAVIFLLILFKNIFHHHVSNTRAILDQLPPFNLYKRVVAARFLETLGILVSNGVVFKSALRIMQYQASPYLLAHIAKMENLLSAGKTNVAEVFATGLIEKDDLLRLKLLAEVKGFEHGLIKMGVHGTEKANHTLKFIAKLLGGTLLVVAFYLILITIQGIYITGMFMGNQ